MTSFVPQKTFLNFISDKNNFRSISGSNFYFYFILAGPPGAARDYFTISLWKSPVQIDLMTLQALGWGEPPTNNFFYIKTHPKEQLLFAGPRPILKAYTPIWQGGPCGPQVWVSPPTNKILHGKPTPRSNFYLLAPAQFFTLQGFSDGITIGGIPRGQHLGTPPGSAPSQGEMRNPCQISGWLVV